VNSNKVNYHYWANVKWPFPTLMRYHKICEIEKDIQFNDFLMYIDVDMSVRSELPDFQKNSIFAVEHPGHKKVSKAPFENNDISLAFLPKEKRKIYVCGGVQGGDTKEYLNICKKIKNDIDLDLKNNYIPKWHDETYWNKYVNLFDKKIIYDRSYCWPEQWIATNTPGKIVALSKNHSHFRDNLNVLGSIRFYLSGLLMYLKRPRDY